MCRQYNKDLPPGIDYPKPNLAEGEPVGATVFAHLHGTKKKAPNNNEREPWDDVLVFSCSLEGTMESEIKMLNHDANPDGSPECTLDGKGRWWFSRYFDYFNLPQGISADLDPQVDWLKLFADIIGVCPTGKMRVDDVELSVKLSNTPAPIGTWQVLVGRPLFGQGAQRNYSFEDAGNPNKFAWWGNIYWPYPSTEDKFVMNRDHDYYHDDDYYFPATNNTSCFVERLPESPPKAIYPVRTVDIAEPEAHWQSPYLPLRQTDINITDPDLKKLTNDHPYRIQAFMRTQEVDTGRLIHAYEWRLSGNHCPNPSKYKGGIWQTWRERGLPFDDTTNSYWQLKAALIGVAAWNWNYQFPNSPDLTNLYFDPFLMLRKEVTWWNKT